MPISSGKPVPSGTHPGALAPLRQLEPALHCSQHFRPQLLILRRSVGKLLLSFDSQTTEVAQSSPAVLFGPIANYNGLSGPHGHRTPTMLGGEAA
jgi:hypothetical protein